MAAPAIRRTSLSKPRFPAIQSLPLESPRRLRKSIKAAIPSHPKRYGLQVNAGLKVYQSRDSQPSKAKRPRSRADPEVYQSRDSQPSKAHFMSLTPPTKVYQSRDSQPSKARAASGVRKLASLSKPRFPAIQSLCYASCTGKKVYQSRDSQPSKAMGRSTVQSS